MFWRRCKCSISVSSLVTLYFIFWDTVSEPKFTDSSKWAPQLAPGIHLSPSRECSACRYDAITPRFYMRASDLNSNPLLTVPSSQNAFFDIPLAEPKPYNNNTLISAHYSKLYSGTLVCSIFFMAQSSTLFLNAEEVQRITGCLSQHRLPQGSSLPQNYLGGKLNFIFMSDFKA